MNRLLLLAVLLAVLLLASHAGAADGPAIPAGTQWTAARTTLLDVRFGDSGFQARWEFLHCECGDLLVRLEETAPDGVMTGELLLVGGEAVLARGPVAVGDDLPAMLQAPALMLQLALGILQRGYAAGPAVLEAEHVIRLAEPKLALGLKSGNASGAFEAPWSASGKVWPQGEVVRRFELMFQFTNPEALNGVARIELSGGMDFNRDAFPLSGNAPLDEWKLQWLGSESPITPEPGLTLEALRRQTAEPGIGPLTADTPPASSPQP